MKPYHCSDIYLISIYGYQKLTKEYYIFKYCVHVILSRFSKINYVGGGSENMTLGAICELPQNGQFCYPSTRFQVSKGYIVSKKLWRDFGIPCKNLLTKEDIRGSSTDSTHQFSWTSVKQGLKSVVWVIQSHLQVLSFATK